jgi:hypothetical protein
MTDESVLSIFPSKQIKPYDGMSVTADTWAQAHDEHRKAREAHDLFFHGAGIVCGLEVVANDPADRYVFISPGVAVDPAGNVIVLSEQVAYDFGASVEGMLYLMLGHGEREIGGVQKETRYIQDEFVVAARPSLPKRPAVELARINMANRGSAIKNASDPRHPASEELDLRYRHSIAPQPTRLVRVGLAAAAEPVAECVSGWDHLSLECQRSTSYRLAVDADVSLLPESQNYDLLFLYARGEFKLEAARSKELAAYLSQGKHLMIEALDDTAEKSCTTLLSDLSVSVKPMAESDALLTTPYVFSGPPPGAQNGQVWLGNNVVYSTAGYSLAWTGSINGAPGTRADIRSALEWGVNLLKYCLG